MFGVHMGVYCSTEDANLANMESSPGFAVESITGFCRPVDILTVFEFLESDGEILYNSLVLPGPGGLPSEGICPTRENESLSLVYPCRVRVLVRKSLRRGQLSLGSSLSG